MWALPGQGLTVAQAAALTGLSKEAIRKRIRRGSWVTWKAPDGSWLIDPVLLEGEASQDAAQDTTTPHLGASAPAQAVNLAQRAEDMAVYSHRLLEPYVAQIAELSREVGAQAERIGHLELELEQARVRLRAELDMAKAGDRDGDLRPWWRRLLAWG